VKGQIPDPDIWRLELKDGRWNGKAPIRPVSSTRADDMPVYSPDGRRIAFGSTRAGSYELWVCDSDGSNPVQLTSLNGLEGVASISWSPDARWIYLASDLQLEAGRTGVSYMISVDGGRPKRLSPEEVPRTFSRDGQWVYFKSARSGSPQIWKSPVNGGDPIQVTRHGADEWAVESTDGRFLYYLNPSGWPESSLWRIPVQGGQETRVLKSLFCSNFAIADRGIYFMPWGSVPGVPSQPGPNSEDLAASVQFLNFSTGRTEQVAKLVRRTAVPPADGACGFSLSPDGRYLLYTEFEPTRLPEVMMVENFH